MPTKQAQEARTSARRLACPAQPPIPAVEDLVNMSRNSVEPNQAWVVTLPWEAYLVVAGPAANRKALHSHLGLRNADLKNLGGLRNISSGPGVVPRQNEPRFKKPILGFKKLSDLPLKGKCSRGGSLDDSIWACLRPLQARSGPNCHH